MMKYMSYPHKIKKSIILLFQDGNNKVLNSRILISIFETLLAALPSLRSREGMGVS